jgi:hypothetical protein
MADNLYCKSMTKLDGAMEIIAYCKPQEKARFSNS